MVLLASMDWSTAASLVVIAFLVGMILLGSLWSAHREFYIRDQEKRSHAALTEMMALNTKITANAEVIGLRLAEMAGSTRDIRIELITVVKEKAEDQKELALDIERRLREIIRDIGNHGGGPTGVNVFAGDTRQSVNHFSGDNASVAQGQSVNQTKHAG